MILHRNRQSAQTANGQAHPSPLRRPVRLRWILAPAAACVAVLPCSSVILAAAPVEHSGLLTVSPTVKVGNGPDDLAFDAGTDTLYALNQGGTISVVDAGQCNAVALRGCDARRVGTISLPAGSSPQGIAVNVVTDTVYVADTDSNEISVINGATCNASERSGCATTQAVLADPAGPGPVAVDDTTDTVYVGNPILGGNDTLSVFNGATCDGLVRSGCGQTSTSVHVGLEPWNVEVDALTNTVYVANEGFNETGSPGDTVSVVDGATCNAVQAAGCGHVATITVGAAPAWISVDDAAHTAYTANQTAGTVSVINVATCDATDTAGCGQKTMTVKVGANPSTLTVDQKLHTLYVANNLDDTVSVINTATCNATIASSCDQDAPTTPVGMGPQDLVADQATGTLYAADFAADTVSVLNAASCDAVSTSGCRALPRTAAVGADPSGVAVDTANGSVYVANQGSGTVSVLDAQTCSSKDHAGCRRPSATVRVGTAPAGVAVDQATGTVYVTNSGGNTVSVIDAATCNATDHSGCTQTPAEIPVGSSPFGVAVDQATDSVYVTQPGTKEEGDTVSVINGAGCNATTRTGCGQSPATVTVGEGPFGIAVDATTNTVYVTNTGQLYDGGHVGDTVSVVDGVRCDGTVTSGCGQTPATVNVGPYPFGIAVDAATNTVFVVNNNGGDGPSSLSVISGSTCDASDNSGCSTTPPSRPGIGRAPNGIAFDPSTDAVYTANYEDASVSIVAASRAPAAGAPPRLAVGSLPGAVAVDPANHTVYVTSSQDGTVAVLSDR